MAHTNAEDRPWWRVDLEYVYCILGVTVLNRCLAGKYYIIY